MRSGTSGSSWGCGEVETQWITWALQGLIAAVLGVIWGQLSAATKAIAELATEIARNYMPRAECVELIHGMKAEWASEVSRMRDNLHDVRNMAITLKAKEDLRELIARDGPVKS